LRLYSPPKLAPKKKRAMKSAAFIAVIMAHIRGVVGSTPSTATKAPQESAAHHPELNFDPLMD
jgi:hypothetical protein